MRHQARGAAQNPDPHPHGQLGHHPARLPGGGHRGPLRRQPGRRLRLERDYGDIYSGWTCNRAVWNKGAHGIVEATREVEGSLPFDLLGFDTDNGSES